MNRLFVWGCALLAAGCGVGRALVDHQKSDAGTKFPRPVCRDIHPACVPPPATFLPPERRLEPGSLPLCPIELPAGGELDARGGEMELHDCRFELAVFDPVRVRVLGARLRNVVFDLQGPIRLELSAGSSLALAQIRTDLERTESSLLLEDATASDLIVTSGRGWTLEVVRSALAGALLKAERVEVETSTFQHVGIQATELQVIATLLEFSQLTVEHATVSASEFFNTSVAPGCDTLLLAGTAIADSRFGACRGALRLHNDMVRASALDGPLEIDMTTIDDSLFGLDAPTRLWAWETNIYGGRFCASSQQTRFADVSLHCVSCEGEFTKSKVDVCYDAESRIDTQPNACPAFEDPAPCEGEFPERGWPEDRLRGATLPDFLRDGGLSQPDGGPPEP